MATLDEQRVFRGDDAILASWMLIPVVDDQNFHAVFAGYEIPSRLNATRLFGSSGRPVFFIEAPGNSARRSFAERRVNHFVFTDVTERKGQYLALRLGTQELIERQEGVGF